MSFLECWVTKPTEISESRLGRGGNSAHGSFFPLWMVRASILLLCREWRGLGCSGVAQGVGYRGHQCSGENELQRSWDCHLDVPSVVPAVMCRSLMALTQSVDSSKHLLGIYLRERFGFCCFSFSGLYLIWFLFCRGVCSIVGNNLQWVCPLLGQEKNWSFWFSMESEKGLAGKEP